jgi:polyisoprenoid-binding protein YceI
MKYRLTHAVALATLAALPAAALAQSATYAIDPNHTFVTFEVTHFGTSTNRGRFDRKSGTVQLDRAARSGKVELSLDMTSINSGVPAFDKHLQSADFFDVAKFPSATFTGERIGFDGDKVTEVAGQLTLHGKTQPLVLKATRFSCYAHPMLKREVCGGDFEATLLRSQFGVGGYPAVAPDQVRLVIQVEAVRQ